MCDRVVDDDGVWLGTCDSDATNCFVRYHLAKNDYSFDALQVDCLRINM